MWWVWLCHLVVFLTYPFQKHVCLWMFFPTVCSSASFCSVRRCVWQQRSGLLMIQGEIEREMEGEKKNDAEVWKEIILTCRVSRVGCLCPSNSHLNLHGCRQVYTAWSRLRLYLCTQWGMFSKHSVVSLCSVNSLTLSPLHHDRDLIRAPTLRGLYKAIFWLTTAEFIKSN